MASLKMKRVLEIINDEGKSPEEKATLICGEHQTVLNEIKDERDEYKGQAEKAADLQKQLDDLNAEGWRDKYEKLNSDFEAFKQQAASAEQLAKVKEEYKQLLIEAGISEKRAKTCADAAEGLGWLKDLKLGNDGKLEGVEEVKKAINSEWADFIPTITQKGAKVENPPQAGKATRTKEEIMAIEDTAERQKAMFENKELFGIV